VFMFGESILTKKNPDNSQQLEKIYFNKKRLFFASLIDKVLSLLYRFGNSPTENNDSREYRRILLLESHLIGDVIMALPAYKAIREKFPNAELIFWGNQWGKDLLEDQCIFDQFFIMRIPWARYDYSLRNLRQLHRQIQQLKKPKIDLAVDFRGDPRNIFLLYLTSARKRVSYDFTGGSYWLTDVVAPSEKIHLTQRSLNITKYLGMESHNDIPMLDVPETKIQDAKKYFNGHGLNNIVFIHPGASQPKRLWPADRFAKIIEYLRKNSYSPVLLCGPNDIAIIESIQNKCTVHAEVLSVPLSDIPAYLSCCDFFIGLDSGMAHISAAVGKNVIVLFGPQDPAITAPRGRSLIQIIRKGDFACRPCDGPTCKYNNACMRAIQTEDIVEAIEKNCKS